MIGSFVCNFDYPRTIAVAAAATAKTAPKWKIILINVVYAASQTKHKLMFRVFL